MSINPEYFTGTWLLIGTLLYAFTLLISIRGAQWWRLTNAGDLNVLLYTMLGLFFMWLMNTEFENSLLIFGPTLHLLGATLMTLMFGWAFAILAMSLMLIASPS